MSIANLSAQLNQKSKLLADAKRKLELAYDDDHLSADELMAIEDEVYDLEDEIEYLKEQMEAAYEDEHSPHGWN